MEFLQRLFGRDVYNLICDYYHPISDLARQRKEHMNKAFLMCYGFIKFNNYLGKQIFELRYDWIKRLRSIDIYLNNGNVIKLRTRNKDIPYKYINDIYKINEDYPYLYRILYIHQYHEERILTYTDRTPTYPSGTPTNPTYL